MTVPPIFLPTPKKNNDLLASMVATSWKDPFPSLQSTPSPLQFLRPLPPKQFKDASAVNHPPLIAKFTWEILLNFEGPSVFRKF